MATPAQTNNHSYEERVAIASAALEVGINGALTGSDWIPAMTALLYSQMAELDIMTHKTTYKGRLETGLPSAVAEARKSPYVWDYILHGYAASRAYTVYQDPQFLVVAQQCWNFGRTYWISNEDVQSKKIATKSLSLRSDCNGISPAGGVFLTNNSTDGAIESSTTSAFFVLSALLFELTSNDTYNKAATQTLQFLKTFDYFPRSNGAYNEPLIFALDGDMNCIGSPYPWYSNAGDIIEGLSILASITGNSSTLNDLQDTITSATRLREEQREDLVLDWGSHTRSGYPGGDPFLVRGLSTAYRRNKVTKDVSFIRTFIDAQYNALLNNARFPETNVYGGSWIVPPREISFDLRNQTFAAIVLVQAVFNASDNITSTTTTTGPQTPSLPSSNKVGVIVAGGVVGGLALLTIISCLTFAFLRRQKRRSRVPADLHVASPFVLPDSTRERDVSTLTTSSHPSPGVVKSRSRFRISSGRKESVTTSPQRDLVDPPGDGSQVMLSTMSTVELERALNTRVQNPESWHDDLPPAYRED